MAQAIAEKLDKFIENKSIPHIIFHGDNNVGKKTILFNFLNKLYGIRITNYDLLTNDNRNNILFVKCAHGKGIKFIREELKQFAKTNVAHFGGKFVNFKSVVLFNADYLTTDAQSALRRCIEIFSYNTRFFIVVENKHKLLKPIQSRFCDFYVPEPSIENNIMMQPQTHVELIPNLSQRIADISTHDLDICYRELRSIAADLYNAAWSCDDLLKYIKSTATDDEFVDLVVIYYEMKSEIRCDMTLMIYLLWLHLQPASALSPQQLIEKYTPNEK